MLTPKDVEVYRIQWKYKLRMGFAPTIREIAKLYGTPSWSHILDSLERLERAGLIEKANLTREGIYKPTEDPDAIDWGHYLEEGDKIWERLSVDGKFHWDNIDEKPDGKRAPSPAGH